MPVDTKSTCPARRRAVLVPLALAAVTALSASAACAPTNAPRQAAASIGATAEVRGVLEGPPLAEPVTWAQWKRADYLMLGPRALLSAAAPLVAHRERRGHVVATLATEDLFARFSAGRPETTPLEEGIRRLVRHTQGNLRFVLLVGDVDAPAEGLLSSTPPSGTGILSGGGFALRRASSDTVPLVPTFYRDKIVYYDDPGLGPPLGISTPGFDGHRYPTDRPYALAARTGPAGTQAKGGPPARELAVGRVPARSEDEVRGFVRKVIEYETAPDSGAWARRIAVFAGPANYGPLVDRLVEGTASRLLDDEVSYDYDVDFVFAKEDSPYAYRLDRMRDKFRSDLNQGALIAAYVGHGSWYSFDDVSFRDSWYRVGTLEDAAQLRIPQGKPLFLSFTCDTGAFDLPAGRVSVAERLALNPDGPIAVFASSRESHPYPNALYGSAVVEQFAKGRVESIGEGLVKVREQVRRSSIVVAEMLVEHDVDALKTEHEGLYNLFGDPATRLRYPMEARMQVVTSAAPVSAAPPNGRTVRARAGSTIAVKIQTPSGGAGRALLTLETRRSVIRPGLVPPAELARMRTHEALAAMADNHKKAIDKVVSRAERDLSAGAATIELAVPKQPGTYVLKSLVMGAGGTAAGHLHLIVEPESARRADGGIGGDSSGARAK
jgi:hypothetical protein